MYPIVLSIHNIVRWIVLILGLLAVILPVLGWIRKEEWSESHRKVGIFFTSSVDIQLLLGFLLYFVFSEWALKAITEKGMAFVMGQGEYRFFAVEHLFTMLLGVVFAHLGSALPKKVDDSQQKFRLAALWHFLAILVILAGIPWSRPLFPGL